MFNARDASIKGFEVLLSLLRDGTVYRAELLYVQGHDRLIIRSTCFIYVSKGPIQRFIGQEATYRRVHGIGDKQLEQQGQVNL